MSRGRSLRAKVSATSSSTAPSRLNLRVHVRARLAARGRARPAGEPSGVPDVVVVAVEPEGDIRSRNVQPETRPEVHQDLGLQLVGGGRVSGVDGEVDRRRVVAALEVEVGVEPARADPDAVVLTERRRDDAAARLGVSGRGDEERAEQKNTGDVRGHPSQPLRSSHVQGPLQIQDGRCPASYHASTRSLQETRGSPEGAVRWRGPTRESGSPAADGWSAAAGSEGSSDPPWATHWELPLPPSGSRRCGTRAGRCTARPRCAAGRPSSWRC